MTISNNRARERQPCAWQKQKSSGRRRAFRRRLSGHLLAQASQRISAEFHLQVRAAGLSVTEWRVLASLEGSAGETIGTLAVLAITKQPTLSKVVQRMEAWSAPACAPAPDALCITPRGL